MGKAYTKCGRCSRLWPWLTGAIVVGLLEWAVFMQGCAIAQKPTGEYVIGIGMSGDGTTASGIGTAVGGILGLTGVPGASVIGVGVTSVLAALGYGVKKAGDAKAARAAHEAENRGWDAARDAYSPPPGAAP